MADADRPLSAKQVRFIEEYLVDLNATQAALRAGYSPRTAYRTGSENLRKPQIDAAITAAMAARSDRTGITQDGIGLDHGIGHSGYLGAKQEPLSTGRQRRSWTSRPFQVATSDR